MPRQVIINMGEQYPFGECEQGDDQTVRVLVRRRVPWSEQPEIMLEKANFFRKLNHSCIIRLEQTLQEEECLHLLYEYVPIRMQTWIQNINQKFIESFCRQLIELGEYLAKCYISVELALQNVGMDQNYKPKYFLDFDFQVNEGSDKQILKNNYHTQVLSLFRPYVQAKPHKNIRAREEEFRKDSSSYKANEISNSRAVARISQNDNSSSNIRLKEKAVALQKERKNQSLSVIGSQWQLIPQKNRKQSILSSVSNIKINRLGRRIDEIKNKMRGIYSPEPLYLRRQERSIQKGSNSIAFKWDSTEKLYTTSLHPRQQALETQAFCSNIFREIQQEESIFQKFQQNLAKQLTMGLPLKKNQSLKAKEYEQMKKSDDGYFKDFFQVLEDKPKILALEAPPSNYSTPSNTLENTRNLTQTGRSLVRAEDRFDISSSKHGNRLENMKTQTVGQLETRVKTAINRSKNLINKFRADK